MRTQNRLANRAALQIEHLEPRWALAGNVSVAGSGLDLKINGDNLENSISIEAQEIAGVPHWVITGLEDDFTGEPTTINGEEDPVAVPVPAGGFRNVTINMKKALTPEDDERGKFGFDAVQMDLSALTVNGNLKISGSNAGLVNIEDLTVRGNTTISFKNGVQDDFFGLVLGSGISIGFSDFGLPAVQGGKVKDLKITTGNESDEVEIVSSTVGGKLTVDTKKGDDAVDIGSEEGIRFPEDAVDGDETPTTVQGTKVTIKTGAGGDSITLQGVDFFGKTDIQSGSENDFVSAGTFGQAQFGGDVSINLGAGDPAPDGIGGPADDHEGDSLAILGTRNDDFNGFNSSAFVDGSLKIKSGAGDDCIGLLGVVVTGDLKIDNTGAGDDFVGAADLVVEGKTTVKTGAGDDIVAIGLRDGAGNPLPDPGEGNFLAGDVAIDTGAGDDLVAAQGTTFLQKVKVTLGAGDDTVAEIENNFTLGADVALVGSRGGAGVDALLSEDLGLSLQELNALQFETDQGNETQIFEDIFARVEECFGDILASFGIELNPDPD
jgi:hypothetical protein